MGVEINPVVDLAAPFTNVGQLQAVKEARAAADIRRRLPSRAVAPVGVGQRLVRGAWGNGGGRRG